MTADLQLAIDEAVGRFGPFGAAYPIFLAPPAGREVVPAQELLSAARLPDFFNRAILEWTARPQDEDVRAAASRFARRYCGSVAAAALIPLAHGVAVDVQLDRLAFVIRTEMPMGVVLSMDSDAVAVSGDRPTRWPLGGQDRGSAWVLRDQALTSLVRDNLAPAFERILATAHVSMKLLWSTAAEQIDMLYENGVDDPDQARQAAQAEDRDAILFGPRLPGHPGPNPMLDLLTWESVDDPDFPRPLQVRRICCINYVVPGRQAYCRTCGLLRADERLALWRSWKASAASSSPQVDGEATGPG